MKKILMILLIFLFSITAACNKNNKIDISNLNEDMLKIEYCELKSNGFIGVIYQNYLCYGPNTYIPTITIPTKAEFENGEYVNETYKLEYNDCIYIVKNNHLQINNETNQFQFNYEKNDEYSYIRYNIPEFNFSYKETKTINNIKIEFTFSDINGNSGEYQICVYDDYFEVIHGYYSPSFYITKEVYYIDGTFTNFVISDEKNNYNAYQLISYGLRTQIVDNISCLLDTNGNFYKAFDFDENCTKYDIFDYQNKTKFIMIRQDLISNSTAELINVLTPYFPLVIDENSTLGLHYKQINNSDEYEFYGLGTSTSKTIIVSSKVNGVNVTKVSDGIDIFGDYSSEYAFLDYPIEIYLPDTILKIGKFAFADGDKITKISIPNSCYEIGKAAFYDCKMLEEVILPENLIYLENYTFTNCNSLKYVYIPANLEQIGSYVFQNCTSLKELNFGGTIEQWEELTKYTKDTLYLNTNIEKVICSNGVIEVNN